MKILLIRYAGYWIFSLCTQLLFWVTQVNPLDEINVFTYPRLLVLAGIGSIVWLVLDAVQVRSSRGMRRHVMFWVPLLILAGTCLVLPFMLSKDGLASGILLFLFLYWLGVIAVYQLILEFTTKLRRKWNTSEHGVAPYRR
jgi:uncharacterized membrane protein HdeD (DUF308 family)